jgi:hypothetical protein
MTYRRRTESQWVGGTIGLVLLTFGVFWLLGVGLVKLIGGVSEGAGLLSETSRERQRSGTFLVLGCAVLGLVLGASSGDATATVLGLLAGSSMGMALAFAVAGGGATAAKIASGQVVLGEQPGTFGRKPFTIPRETRVRHLFVDGPTGAGKTTLLQNLVYQDALAPQHPGLLVIDVKDNLVGELAALLPPDRAADVLLFDPADTASPPAFNPLADVPAEGRTLAAAELLTALKRLHEDTWGPRLEHVLRMVLLTLLETPDATMLDIVRLLSDSQYRAWAVQHVSNFSVCQFWTQEFPAIVGVRESLTNVLSIVNKLGVLSYPEVRNVLGQTRRGLDLREAMDSGKIVLAHLPQGVLGEDASHFLAALLVGKLQLAAQSRVNLPSGQRRPFYAFIDEFQNYQTSAMDKLITEGRSMQVGLVAACQFPEQLPRELRLSIERNCAYALHCRLNEGRHLLEAVKLQEPNARDAQVFLAPLPPPAQRNTGQVRTVRARSRARLSRPRQEVELEIRRIQSGQFAPAVVGGSPRIRF